MTRRTKIAAATAALVAMTAANTAAAQSNCLTEREVAHSMIYAAPSAIEAAQNTCAPRLSKSGFLATGANSMKSRYADLTEEVWPNAKAAMLKLGSKRSEGQQIAGMMSQMPDEAVRPFVDAMLLQMIAKEIQPNHCANIERGLSLVNKLQPRDAGALIGFVFNIAGTRGQAICATETK
ncbi:hypothetical protein ACXYN8_07250 [Altererythrobacter sp. CAU 1778]